MSVIDHEERISKLKQLNNPTSQELRERAATAAKSFKTAWVELAQTLYAVWRDKLYEYWGYEKFEHYVEREVGIKKSMALKLIKTYSFIEDQEPQVLKEEYLEQREPSAMPDIDALHLLRLARGKKELTRQDYQEIRKQVLEKATPAGTVRKDLTALIKERKNIDPDKEREQRHEAAVRRFLNAIRSFRKDAEALKLVRVDVVKKAEELFKELESELQ